MQSSENALENFEDPQRADRLKGVFYGLALGDAVGYQYSHAHEVPDDFGISAHTQMSLYVADGLLEVMEWAHEGSAADPAASVWLALLRWYRSQRGTFPPDTPQPPDRWIDQYSELKVTRSPNEFCLSGLEATEMRLITRVANPEATDAAALTRSAAYGLLPNIDEELARSLTHQGAVLTHGSPEAWKPALDFVSLLRRVISGHFSPQDAPHQAVASGDSNRAASQTLHAAQDVSSANSWDEVRAGIVACSDPAATGTVAGALWGARHGFTALPKDEVSKLVEEKIIEHLWTRWADLSLARTRM